LIKLIMKIIREKHNMGCYRCGGGDGQEDGAVPDVGGDGREHGVVPGGGGDGDGGGGSSLVPSMVLKAEEKWDGDGGEGGGAAWR
jgi:hypothetical protein